MTFLQERLGIGHSTKEEIEMRFLNQVISDVQKRPRGGISQLMLLLSTQDYSAKKQLLKSYAYESVQNLELFVEQRVSTSSEKVGSGLEEGNALFKEGSEILKQIALGIAKNDPKYQRVADTLAKGLKKCAEEYFEDCSMADNFDVQGLLGLYI